MFSKIGHFEFISECDLAIIYHVLETIPFNMVSMMVTYIGEAISQTKMNISYRMAFTKIFRKYGIRISNNEPKDVLKHSDFYTLGILARMSYKKEERKWTRKIGFDPHPSPILPPPTPRTSTFPPPRTSISSPQIISTPPFIDTQTP